MVEVIVPYIKKTDRINLDEEIAALTKKLREMGDDNVEGNLNYTITQVLLETMGANWRYKKINQVVGVLECVKQEFYRRLAAPYERGAIDKNGDIDGYDPSWRVQNIIK